MFLDSFEVRPLVSERLVLCPTTEYSAIDLYSLGPKYRSWMSDPDVVKGTGSSRPKTQEYVDRILAEYAVDPSRTKIVHYIITSRAFGAVGDAEFRLLDRRSHFANHDPEFKTYSRRAETRIMMGEHRGSGYGTEALGLMLRHAFDETCLDVIYIDAYSDNEPSLNLHQRLGFETIFEGIEAGSKRPIQIMRLTKDKFDYMQIIH